MEPETNEVQEEAELMIPAGVVKQTLSTLSDRLGRQFNMMADSVSNSLTQYSQNAQLAIAIAMEDFGDKLPEEIIPYKNALLTQEASMIQAEEAEAEFEGTDDTPEEEA